MPREEKVTTSAQRPFGEAKQSRQPVAERSAGGLRAVLLERMILTGAVLATLTVGLYVLLYFQARLWQMLANAGCLVLGILCLVPARRLARRGKLDAAGYWILGAVMVVFGGGESLWAGATVYLTLSVLLLMVIVGIMIRPRRWSIWVVVGGLYMIYILWVNGFKPLPRYDITQSPVLRIYTPGILFLLALAVLWQFIHAYQRTSTIRIRLLIAFVLMVLLPVAAISAASAVLGWQSGRQQVLSQLESVATLKEAEIETWVNSLRTDLISALTGEDATRRTIALLQMPDPSKYLGYWVRNHFQQAIEQGGRFEELLLLDLQGQVILSTDTTQEGKTHSDQTFFQEGLKGPYVQPPFYFTSPDQMSVVVVRPVVDEQGYVWGVLAGRASMATLNEMMRERAGLGETGETYLIGRDHALLTEPRFGREQIYIRTQGANAAIENQINGSGLYDGYRGMPVVGVYHWLSELQVALLAEQDQSEAFGAIQTTLGVTAGVALTSVLLAVVASLLITQGIATPLADLAETAVQIAAGDLERVAEVEREDEIGALAQAFNSMTAQLRELIGSLEQRVADRTRGLLTAAEVARATTLVLDLDELLHQVVNLVRERFDLYYVSLFLLDKERRFAVLRAGTGEAGQRSLEQGWRHEVGGNSMVGWCVAHAKPHVAPDVSQEPTYFAHPLLPDTRSETVLPLIARGRVIGALNVESVEIAAFDEADIAVLQTMADQVAVAIDNAQLFAEAQAALKEMEATQQRYLGQAWSDYTRGRAVSGYEQTHAGVKPLAEVLPEVQQAVTEQRPVVRSGDPLPLRLRSGQTSRHVRDDAGSGLSPSTGSGLSGDTDHVEESSPASSPVEPSALVAPILLRGQPIGALGFKEEGRQWSADDIALAKEIAEQLALAADNLRLLDETQRRATRERLIGDVTSCMRETLDMETVLKTAVQEVRQALGLPEVVIRLVTEDMKEESL